MLSNCSAIIKKINTKTSKYNDENIIKLVELISSFQEPFEELQSKDISILIEKLDTLSAINAVLTDIIIFKQEYDQQVDSDSTIINDKYIDQLYAILSQLRNTIVSNSTDSGQLHQLRLDHDLNKKQYELLRQIQSPPTTLELLYISDPPRENYDDMRPVIGQGVFSITYRKKNATDEVTVYAVKILEEISAKQNYLDFEQIYKEALVLQDISHSNIVRHFAVFRTCNNQLINIVMELVEGWPLHTYINCTEPPSKQLITKWLMQTLQALRYLHDELHIQHRDIKPRSILITTARMGVKLTDILLETFAYSSAQDHHIFTSHYSSMEKISNMEFDGRDDVWGVGCVWTELITRVALRDRSGYISQRKHVELRQVVVKECIACDSNIGALIGKMLTLD